VSMWRLAVLLLPLPATAWAHSPIEGLGDFFNGMLHPVFVPAHLLLVFALGLLIGQQGVFANLTAIWSYLLGVLIGAALAGAGFTLTDASIQELAVLLVAMGVALLVVLAVPLPRPALVLLGLAAGLLLGLDSVQAELEGTARHVALFGSAVALYLLLLYPMATAERFSVHPCLRVGVRIIGSWIAASALLVLALLLAPAA